ncbi:MAG: methyltransferase domain-containing protein [Thermodesulfobacteriota bacterium]|nr:methyltransferase domain-containing protein [Thermodesulfobacteriota bacterium]
MRWGEQLLFREKVHKQYPGLWSLKIIRKRLPFILKYLKDGEAVLEIGAFNRELGERIKKHYSRIQYKSMDIDPTYLHDYASLEEIEETFDMILLFEVIEHLNREKGRGLARKIYEILKPGGRVILTTPNVYTPGQYWKDVSHETPYHYEELGGLFLSEGFESIEMYRLFSEPFLRYFFRVCLCSPLFHFLGIDFTRSILIVARKV